MPLDEAWNHAIGDIGAINVARLKGATRANMNTVRLANRSRLANAQLVAPTLVRFGDSNAEGGDDPAASGPMAFFNAHKMPILVGGGILAAGLAYLALKR